MRCIINIINYQFLHKIQALPIPKIKYYNFLNDKSLGKEATNILLVINNGEFYENIEENVINKNITKITNLKAFIPKNFFNNVEITADGNCFFRAVSKYLSGEEDYHYLLRKLVYN